VHIGQQIGGSALVCSFHVRDSWTTIMP